MTLLTKSKKPSFLITKNFSKKLTQMSDLLLSPEFYWVKKVTLNVKFAYEVKKMAESIFDGFLPSGDYEYKVFKVAPNEYILVAYDIKLIQDELIQLGIDMDFVANIYTLQSEFLQINAKVDEEFGLATCKGVIVYSASKLLDLEDALHVEELLEDKTLSKNYIYHSKSKKNSLEYFNLMIWFVLILNLVVLLDTIKLYKDKKFLENQKNTFIKKHNLPSTSFQITSMKEELSFIEKNQLGFRDAILYINKFHFLKDELFDSVYFKNNVIVFSVSLESKQREEILKKYISKKLTILKSKNENKSLVVEIQL
ncbi:hypothetical protein [Sulfurospirillum arcachonense]|uniref:hypothetical protein n=1 Tax=Sulfurospirillum arcachonense TaxID=57666 RepID=UPI00046A1DE2|nr:hypothetical protein [Sulfurospirillum arcachonense]